jgi:pyruvate/2-oxoglutarate/acetoin dehydrogenase E1 component
VALSKMVHEALAAAGAMAGEGISVEVIDPRTLVPLDVETIRRSVTRTGRLVVVDEACRTCSAAAEIVSLVCEDDATFAGLKSPPRRVCGLDIPIPYSPPMESFAIPDRHNIVEAINNILDAKS